MGPYLGRARRYSVSPESVERHDPIYIPDSGEVAVETVGPEPSGGTGNAAQLMTLDGSVITIPEAHYAVVRRVLDELARGKALQLIAYPKDLTTQQAADILNVSRTYLLRLLDQGELPYIKVGTHRRVKLQDVLEYRARRSRQRQESLAKMARMAQELGVY